MVQIIFNFLFIILYGWVLSLSLPFDGIFLHQKVILLIVGGCISLIWTLASFSTIHDVIQNQVERYSTIDENLRDKKSYLNQLKVLKDEIKPLIDAYGESEKNLYSNLKNAPKLLATKIDDDTGYAKILQSHIRSIERLNDSIWDCDRKINTLIRKIVTHSTFTPFGYSVFIPKKYKLKDGETLEIEILDTDM